MPYNSYPYFYLKPISSGPLSNEPTITVLEDNSSPCLPIEQVKEIARIDNDAEDNALYLFILTAQDVFESHCRVSLMPKKFVQTMRWIDYTKRDISLVRWPVQEIHSIVYRDENGVSQTIAPAAYELVGKEVKPSVVRPNISAGYEWPKTDNLNGSVQITFTAGFETTAEIPAMYKKAVAELAHYYYDFRTPVVGSMTVNELPDGILRILNRCRINYIN